jgi:glutaconate CoA-transferase subunit B
MMAIAVSREIEDGKTYVIGTGLPLVGATLAKRTHARNAHLIFESGLFEGDPFSLPTSVSDLRICHGASVLWPQYRYFGFLAVMARRGGIEAGFLGGAQIDPYGNLNATSVGDYLHPDVRFTGSGGANGIATYLDTVVVMKHEKRRFVEKVDYVTSPGWVDGIGGRAAVGLDPDKGPRAVITDRGIFRFGPDRRMYLAEYYAGETPEGIAENTGFAVELSGAVETEPPAESILAALGDVD